MKKNFALFVCIFMVTCMFAAGMDKRVRSVPASISSAAFKNPAQDEQFILLQFLRSSDIFFRFLNIGRGEGGNS